MQKIKIDFNNPGLPQHISAVENDSQSRFFQATLCENGKAYTAPAGASYSIMYRGFGPQNQGWYDTINDGAGKRTACKVSGNVVTCEIARQALQVPGHVSIVLCVTTGKGYMLKSWPIECDCKNDRYDSTAEIQSFFYVTQISNESWTQAIQAVEELKNTIDPTLSLSGKAADAKATGDAVGQLKEGLVDLENLVAIKSPNLFDTSKLVNKSISDTGTVVTNQNTYALLNIPIIHGQSIVFNGFLNRTDFWYGFVYNSRGELISRFGLTNYDSSYAGDASWGHYGNKYTAVEEAKYFSIYTKKGIFDQGSNHQLEYGDSLSAYQPYGALSFKYADEIDKIKTKQGKLVAGRGINITGNTIACTIESGGSSDISYKSESRLLNDSYSTLAEIDSAVVLPFSENNIVNEKAKFLFGSHKIKTQNNYFIKSIDKTITNVDKGGVLEIAFEYDGVAFEIGGAGLTTYRFKIDEGNGWKYLDERPLHVSTKNGYRTYTQIRFSFATHRKIIIETSDSVWCLRYDANYQIFPLSSIKPLALFVGSSITEGSAAGEFPMASYGAVCSNEMDWEFINLGVGARGLLSAPENKYSIKDSISDITQFTLADYVFLGGSINDSGYASNPDDLISGVKGIIEAIKTKLPRAKVIVLGTWSPQPDGNNPSHKITNDAIKSSAISSGCAFVDSMNSMVYDENGNIVQNGPGWVTGTFLHLSGDDEMSTIGNCARVYHHENGSIDHTHPGRIGHYYIGMRLASVCRALKLK